MTALLYRVSLSCSRTILIWIISSQSVSQTFISLFDHSSTTTDNLRRPQEGRLHLAVLQPQGVGLRASRQEDLEQVAGQA